MTMRIPNLGCGTKTSDYPGVTNIDWSMYLRIKRNPFLEKYCGVCVKPRS